MIQAVYAFLDIWFLYKQKKEIILILSNTLKSFTFISVLSVFLFRVSISKPDKYIYIYNYMRVYTPT